MLSEDRVFVFGVFKNVTKRSTESAGADMTDLHDGPFFLVAECGMGFTATG
jgi:hypothetical protein